MIHIKSITGAEAAGLAEASALVNARVSFLVLAFVGMALGLVGSCNTGVGGVHGVAYAATGSLVEDAAASGAGNGMTYWQMRSYGKAVTSNPSRILELTGSEIIGIFRAPGLERRDEPAVVWQYMNGDCVLDIYFSADDNGSVMSRQALHFETRLKDGSEAEASSCLKNIVSRRGSPGVHLAQLN